MSKYFGDSEKAIRQLFGTCTTEGTAESSLLELISFIHLPARARGASPCLLFFDEFDSIAHKRSFGSGDDGGSGTGVYARILSTFLNEMDGVGATSQGSTKKDKGEILVIAATNRIDALDAALIRPGRMDKCIEIGLPTTDDKEVFICAGCESIHQRAFADVSTCC